MAGKRKVEISESNMESDTRTDFDQLCRELNMDIDTADNAWDSYADTKHKYTLEVRSKLSF